jgi:hypothetical protein
LLQGTGNEEWFLASCKVARTAYDTVRESFIFGARPFCDRRTRVAVGLVRDALSDTLGKQSRGRSRSRATGPCAWL